MSKPETLTDFRDMLNNLIDSTENIDLKMGLKIILTLISHPKKDVIAYSLGKIYLMIKEESIRNLIIAEIKKMEVDDNLTVRKSAEESIEMISVEVNKYEIFELSYDILNQLTINLENYVNPITDHIPRKSYFISKFNSKVIPKIKNSRFILSWNEILKMNNNGINFGAHTVTAAFLVGIPYSFPRKPTKSMTGQANCYYFCFILVLPGPILK